MYNMDITLLGYKFNLELLILIGVVYLILVGHTVCGCCNMPRIMEGISNMTNSSSYYSNSENIKKASVLNQQQQQ
jgi:hypothetical protein